MTESWAQVIEKIVASGDLSEEWRHAFLAVEREEFIPATIWRYDPGSRGFVPLRRSEDPAGWFEAVHRNEFVITQVNDGAPLEPGRIGQGVTSSSSMPGVMAAMLKALDVRQGMRVLEIGTGTGYNTALLAYRLGDQSVVSVEIDTAVAEQARFALQRAGYLPTLVIGDGAEGYPQGAPYDRVLATVAVTEVPYAWVAQTAPGGLIVTPRGTRYLNSALLRLTVADDGTASGGFVDHAVFMRLRAQRIGDYWPDTDERSGVRESVTELHPYEPCGDYDGGAFAVSVLMPDCERSIAYGNEERTEYDVLIFHEESESWATVEVTGETVETGRYPVRQSGPRRLWDEVERAHTWWESHGRPAYTRFGLTVAPDEQWVWLDEPGHRAGPVRPSIRPR
ncbi:methyltransferase domain-containing protein [Amycolatopsis sp. NPDC059021]|uniref:methyltransferase domain-containing protein n=1 Tax=Amycolatopsis sp. NPDC059021 TaxID=3346704 RepID=UPI00366D91F4